MKKYKLGFYDTFSCIADRCPITCCQEWKISVDEETIKKWKRVKEKKKVKLSELIECKDGSMVMKLTNEQKCPFLNEKQLCAQVLKYGEEYISETCQVFPRIIHDFHDRMEYSLTACCPEVVDLLNKQAVIWNPNEDEMVQDSDLLAQIRSLMVYIFRDTHITVEQALMISFYCLLELYEEDQLSSERIKVYKSKDVIQKLCETICNMEFNLLDTMNENNELLLDICENYRKQNLYINYLEPVAKQAEQLLEDYDETVLQQKRDLFLEYMEKYESLIRKYLEIELYNTFLVPDSDLQSLVVMMQWISLEYVVIRQAIFLKWLCNGATELKYVDVRDYIVVFSRMTGYDLEDIYEYLVNSFQKLLWDWGYLALIVGNRKI